MLEIYNERARDLLDRHSPAHGLKVRQHPKLGVQVVGWGCRPATQNFLTPEIKPFFKVVLNVNIAVNTTSNTNPTALPVVRELLVRLHLGDRAVHLGHRIV